MERWAEGGASWQLDGGFDLHFCPLGKNKCSHQFLNWWQQLSTGQLHLEGFESTSKQKKDTPKCAFLLRKH